MRIDILTVLPGVVRSYLLEGVIGRAIKENRLRVNVVNVRNFTTDRHHSVDDTPYGGGPGLIMKAGPLARAVESLGSRSRSRTVFMTPQGAPFSSAVAGRLSRYSRLILVAGRYEGVDQRFRDAFVDEELSIGDYVLSGGELPALVVLDAVARFLPGVLGNEQSAASDSFSNGLLEHPQYTKPRDFRGMTVPEVLLSGNHSKIRAWQRLQSEARTRAVRPDLWEAAMGSERDERPGPKTRKKQKKG